MAEKTAAKKEHAEKVTIVAKENPAVKAEKKVDHSSSTGPKVETKSDAKVETVQAPQAKKTVTAKSKYIPYVKKENKKKSNEAYKTQMKLNKLRTGHPVFRGRFGKKNIRRKSIAKWDKWRMPHGIDLDKGIEHGFRPKIGYRGCVEVRGIHPSGYREVLVCNFNDLAKIDPKTQAAKLSATIGKRKRNALVTKANEKGIWVLN